MKKVYSKPEIMFENFTTSTNIAGNCDIINSNANANANCSYASAFGNVFVSSPTCEITAPNGEYGNICYHIPHDAMDQLFTS